MTYKEAIHMALTGEHISPEPIGIPADPSKERAPMPEDKMAHVARPSKPLTEADYNGLSCSDAAALHSLKGMDALHQADVAANMYHHGKALCKLLKDDCKGDVNKFASRYVKPKY